MNGSSAALEAMTPEQRKWVHDVMRSVESTFEERYELSSFEKALLVLVLVQMEMSDWCEPEALRKGPAYRTGFDAWFGEIDGEIMGPEWRSVVSHCMKRRVRLEANATGSFHPDLDTASLYKSLTVHKGQLEIRPNPRLQDWWQNAASGMWV